MNRNKIIQEVRKYVKKKLESEPTGHDFWHSWRVWKMARKIAKREGGNLFVIELASLLHDIDDWKFSGNIKTSSIQAKKFLKKLGIDKKVIQEVCYIIDNISFKGAGIKDKMQTLEGKIVQDADRLDVVGAIGIARVFAFGGFKKREIYNPSVKPKLHKTFKEYKKSKGTSINHFYEKVFLLRDRLNTKTAKEISKERYEFLKIYLKQFFKEWRVEI